jgi:hypothetical protein
LRHLALYNRFTTEGPGEYLFDIPLSDYGKGCVLTASRLDCALVARLTRDNQLRVFAVKKP